MKLRVPNLRLHETPARNKQGEETDSGSMAFPGKLAYPSIYTSNQVNWIFILTSVNYPVYSNNNGLYCGVVTYYFAIFVVLNAFILIQITSEI